MYYTDYATSLSSRGFSFVIDLVIPEEIVINLPGLDTIGIVIGSAGSGNTEITASLFVGPDNFELRLDNVSGLALRFPQSILKPMPQSEGATPPNYAQIETRGSIIMDRNFDIRIEGFSGLSLNRAMIGNSGLIISASNVQRDLSRTSSIPEIVAGFAEDFMGIYIGEARIELPSGLPGIIPEDLVLRNCAIGSGGVSGELIVDYSDQPPHYNAEQKMFTGRGGWSSFWYSIWIAGSPFQAQTECLRRIKI